MKRFYKDVSVREESGAWRVLLDGRVLKTQGKAAVELPNRALAEAVADEWRAQGEDIDPSSMYLTRLTFAAIDGAKADRKRVADHALSFGRTDLLSYRAEHPDELVARQAREWDPLLDWAAERFGARLNATRGITFTEQPAEALSELAEAVNGHDDYRLAALHNAATITGSLVLALALIERRLDAEQVFAAATLDEAFQSEKWGVDAEAEARLKRLSAELSGAERFLSLLP
ncbi:MAG TPA: ATP12 family protein [Rhizomicrobium sp.]|nr:ATP12 family protein [Rhizomicrobium sp.]